MMKYLQGLLALTLVGASLLPDVSFAQDVEVGNGRIIRPDVNRLPDLGNMFLDVEEATFDPGLPVGSDFPKIRAVYNGEEITDIDSLMKGKRGLVLVAVRSVDWCPFCREHLGHLQEYVESYERANVALVAVSYDTPELQDKFIKAADISYPIISDVDVETFNALGIALSGSRGGAVFGGGIPHPGSIVVNADKKIVAKYFVEGFDTRIHAEDILDAALKVL